MKVKQDLQRLNSIALLLGKIKNLIINSQNR